PTIPQWLNVEATRANVNFSAVLQNALKETLHLTDR
ncbi:MAG: HicB family protein, partial [Clostridiales bacterium]|nr:HicB family protein [Clostridiales bacterium]